MSLLETHWRRLLGKGEGWHLVRYEIVKLRGEDAFSLTGGFVESLFKGGPRKGSPNFKTLDKHTLETAIITRDEHDEFQRQWQAETGKCFRCQGTGSVPWRWSKDTGAEDQPCPQCSSKEAPRGSSL